MSIHSSTLCLARRPLANRIRQVMLLMNRRLRKYPVIQLGTKERLKERLHEKLSKFKISRDFLAKIHQFRLNCRPNIPENVGTPARWAHTASLLHRIAPFCQCTSIEVFNDTGDAFLSMWQAIDSAKKTIRWATYICKNDEVGRETVNRLIAAAQRGVFVQFIYDDAGNISGRDELLLPLKILKNVSVMRFNPVLPKALLYFTSFRWRASPGIRNHRKIFLVDDAVAFIGGLNIGNEYAGVSCGGSGLFRDTMCRISGRVVGQIRESFFEIMNTTEGSKIRVFEPRKHIEKLLKTPGKYFIKSLAEMQKNRRLKKQWQKMLQGRHQKSGKLTQVLTSNPWARNYGIQKAYQIIINRSRHRIWITTPYFLPTRRLLRSILRAGRRGVDVRIITGSIRTTDPLLMWWGSQYIVHLLLRNYVKLYEYEGVGAGKKMHSKTIVVDGVWCSVGSYNMDVLSNKLLEISVSSIDYSLAADLESQFKKDLSESNVISHDEFQKRSMVQRALIIVIYYIGRAIEKLSFWSHSHPEVETSFDEADL